MKRPPRGYDADHKYIVDLKRKDHFGIMSFKAADLTKPRFIDDVAKSFTSSKPYMKFLCDALRIPF